ncbi:MAG: sigma-70 family RNA polymerase sigma factor [Bacteroidota bacterium]
MNFKILPYQQQEEKWIRACQKGEATAQRQVYEKYARKMLGVCLRYANDSFEAEEILISGFLKVFDKVGQFKGEGSFEGWIRKIMVNQALSYLRKNKSIYLETDLEKADYEPDFQSPNSHLEAEDLLIMIQQLPPGYKTVFNLYAIEGYSHKEIANLLHISESTSKSQLCRARALLQQYLAESESETKITHYGNGR